MACILTLAGWMQAMMRLISQHRGKLLLALALIPILIIFSQAPIAQNAQYHDFADQRSWLGLINAQNILSNLLFLIVGLWGLYHVKALHFESKIERLCYTGFFLGVCFVSIGSSYYHFEPNHWRLVWDRIPIVFSFICLFDAVIAERISGKLASRLFIPFLLYALGAIFYWYASTVSGPEDLRAYILVQLLPIILIPAMIVLYPPRYTKGWMLVLVAFWYVLAKACEMNDARIYEFTQHTSGHVLKHYFAALACAQVAWMLVKRRKITLN